MTPAKPFLDTWPNTRICSSRCCISILDIYEPTVTALTHFLPRIPKGGVIAFDEVNNPDGETRAMLEKLDLRQHRLECLEFEPNISFIQLD